MRTTTKIPARFRRWFRSMREKHRRPYRWYAHDCYDRLTDGLETEAARLFKRKFNAA